jgi:hypothetical protein
MDNTTSDENDDDDLPSSHPAVIAEMRRRRRQQQRQQHRGGWQGEEMELQHEQNQQQDSNTKDVSAAVDLKQFQNTEVGVGYQAKHVIRQRTSAVAVATADAAATATNNKQDVSTNNLNKKMMYDHNNTAQVIPTKEEFIRNDGLRMFRKEIENILSTPA